MITMGERRSRFAERVERVASSLVARPAFWIVFLLAAGIWPFVRPLAHPPPPRLPVLASLPAFELTDQRGLPFGLHDLQGRVWVASFIFTRCETVCPAITAKMKQVQDRSRQLGSEFHLVSFSVDPDHDTPERLAAYARQHGASPRLWSFLTGPAEAVKAAVSDGLKISMGREGGGPEGVSHGTHLVLVDRQGRVRGYYDPADPGVIDRVVRDVGLVVNRGG